MVQTLQPVCVCRHTDRAAVRISAPSGTKTAPPKKKMVTTCLGFSSGRHAGISCCVYLLSRDWPVPLLPPCEVAAPSSADGSSPSSLPGMGTECRGSWRYQQQLYPFTPLLTVLKGGPASVWCTAASCCTRKYL